jgi:hypothetical protein
LLGPHAEPGTSLDILLLGHPALGVMHADVEHMHALIVLPVTILGALLVRPALPRLFRSRAAAREAG